MRKTDYQKLTDAQERATDIVVHYCAKTAYREMRAWGVEKEIAEHVMKTILGRSGI